MKKAVILLALFSMLIFAQQKGSFKDSRDGKTYKTVKILGRIWMAENMNYAVGKSVCYENNELICQKCGRLYDWLTATAICPSGWHLPNDNELPFFDLKSLSILDCGFRYPEGDFNGYSSGNYFWSASPAVYDDWDSNYRNEDYGNWAHFWLTSSDIGTSQAVYHKKAMLSVRCVKD